MLTLLLIFMINILHRLHSMEYEDFALLCLLIHNSCPPPIQMYYQIISQYLLYYYYVLTTADPQGHHISFLVLYIVVCRAENCFVTLLKFGPVANSSLNILPIFQTPVSMVKHRRSSQEPSVSLATPLQQPSISNFSCGLRDYFIVISWNFPSDSSFEVCSLLFYVASPTSWISIFLSWLTSSFQWGHILQQLPEKECMRDNCLKTLNI